MAITWKVEREQPAGLKIKSVWVLLTDGAGFRRAEISRVPLAADLVDYAQSIGLTPAVLWSQATDISEEEYQSRLDVNYLDYFLGVGRAIEKTIRQGGTIGQVLTAGQTAIAADADKLAQFMAYATLLGVATPSTADERVKALLAMKLWTVEGALQSVLLKRG